MKTKSAKWLYICHVHHHTYVPKILKSFELDHSCLLGLNEIPTFNQHDIS